MQSLSCKIPRSPWPASLGCRKTAGVPVELNVAAALAAINPALPKPVVTSLLHLNIAVIASGNVSSNWTFNNAFASAIKTLRAISM